MRRFKMWSCLSLVLFIGWVWAQESSLPGAVPMLVNFSGVLGDAAGKPLTTATTVNFSLYRDPQGGVPLWTETQTVQPNRSGWYTVMLGSTTHGLPSGSFVSGEARWLEVEVQGQPIQPRIMLLSVPYALKAGDAQTLGGLPASAFALAAPAVGPVPPVAADAAGKSPSNAPPSVSSDVTTSGGTVNSLPLFTTATNVQSSIITQTGSGAAGHIGINTTAPATALDVNGGATIRGTLVAPTTGTATSTKSFNSQPQDFIASVFNGGTATAVPQKFQWQAEPVGNNTTTAGGSLNLLYAAGTSKPAETGLHIGSNGQIAFAAGQTFPGTGDGTITGIAAGAGLSGGGTNGSVSLGVANAGITNTMLHNPSLTVKPGTAMSGGGTVSLGGSTTLNLDTTKVPLLAAANTFTGNQTVNGNLSATGVVTGSAFQIGTHLFVYGNIANGNTYLGVAGTPTSTNSAVNTAVGYGSLVSNSTGSENTATGAWSMDGDTTGNNNTATGYLALSNNETGSDNTAAGFEALSLTTGINNTALGSHAENPIDLTNLSGASNLFLGYGAAPSTGTINNAGAIGVLAEVTQSNSIVIGGIAGVNGATVSQNVGIGTTAPISTLEVDSNVSAPTLGPTITMTNTSGKGQISLDFNTYPPSTTGSYNPSARMQIGDQGNYSDVIAFLANTPGAPSNGLKTTMSIDPFGDVHVTGTLSKGAGSFKIDDPLDPANKYLSHSFVESPDMMNIYNGVVTLGSHGSAWIVMPAYFEALNRDFRYQLTSMGRSQPGLYIAREISGNRFRIAGGKPGGRVSWQVTGIRHDAYADAHRIPVEQEKSAAERGKYLHPELFGATEDAAIGAVQTPGGGHR